MDNEKIDDLVARIDKFMQDGGGRMTVKGEGDEVCEVKANCSECGEGCENMACQTPTLHEGLDRDE